MISNENNIYHRKTKKTMEDTTAIKTTKDPKRVTELYNDTISAQSKTIAALEAHIDLLRENIALKEKISKISIETSQKDDGR